MRGGGFGAGSGAFGTACSGAFRVAGRDGAEVSGIVGRTEGIVRMVGAVLSFVNVSR